jgi:hypothetical protein
MPDEHTPALRAAFYHRVANDQPAGPEADARQRARIAQINARTHPPVTEVPLGPGPYARRWKHPGRPVRLAAYGRAASTGHPDSARAWQQDACARSAERHGAVISAWFFDAGCPRSLPLPDRAGGAALLATGTCFDAVIVANFARLGDGTEHLQAAGLAVVLADLDQVIDPTAWDGVLAMVLSGPGSRI